MENNKVNINRVLNLFISNIKTIENLPEKKEAGVNVSNFQNQTTENLNNNQPSIQFNALNRVQQSVLLKELLNLPKDLRDLLRLLEYSETSQENPAKLLNSKDKMINIQDIKALLDTNSKEVINKLLKLIHPTQTNSENFDQIKEVINLINKVTPSRNASANEVLTQTMLLYLPFLPLAVPQDLHVRLEENHEQNSGGQETYVIIIYITTLNMGKFKVTIYQPQSNSVNIDIETEAENKIYLKHILNTINQSLSEYKLSGDTQVHEIKSPKTTKQEKREVKICPISTVSPPLILVSYNVAKIIIETDEKISLLEAREEMIQE